MKNQADIKLIAKLGGPAKLAATLGFKGASGVQRVHNWLERGIPASIKLGHPQLFLADMLEKQHKRREGPSKTPGERPSSKKGR